MKSICCDTSFLLSLYGNDANTSAAATVARRLSRPILLSVLNLFEFENALRLSCRLGHYTLPQVGIFLGALETDLSAGHLSIAPCNFSEVFRQARTLSKLHTLAGGHRGYDMLLVAAALHLGATDFLSFDQRQRTLAKSEGLKLMPTRLL